MKFLSLLLSLVFYTSALAAVDPTIRGSSSSATKNKFVNLEVPANQATKKGPTTWGIETGNANLLVNPSFEHLTDGSGWLTSTTGPSATYLGYASSGTYGSPEFGAKHVQLECNGFFGGAGTCSFYQDVPTSSATQGNTYIRVTADQNAIVTVHNRTNGTAITDTKLIRVVDTSQPIAKLSRLYKLPRNLGTTSTGIEVRITVTAVQVPLVIVDDAFVGAVDLKTDSVQIQTQSTYFTAGSNAVNTTLTGTPTTVGSGNYTVSSGVFTALRNINVVMSCTVTNSSALSTQPTVYFNGVNMGLINTATNTSFAGSVSASGTVLAGQTFECKNTANTSANGFVSVLATNTVNTQIYSSTNANYSRTAYTPVFTGFGTVSAVDCYHSRDGQFLEIDCKWTTGTATAVEARVSLPNSLVSANSSGIRNVGSMGVNASTITFLPSIEPLAGYLVFTQQVGTGSGSFTKINGTSMGATNSFNVRIPISGWENSDIIIGQFNGLESCASTLECTDTFSAKVSATGTVTGEEVDWINGNAALTDGSLLTLTFNSGIFTTAPNCIQTMHQAYDPAQLSGMIETVTSSAVAVRSGVYQTTGGTVGKSNYNFMIFCRRTGVDYIGKTAKAVASDQNLRSIGSVGVDVQEVYFGSGANCTSACTTGTCTICRQVGSKITSITFSSTATFLVNGIDGTKYTCSGTAFAGGTNYGSIIQVLASSTSTYALIQMGSGPTGGNAAYAHVKCTATNQ